LVLGVLTVAPLVEPLTLVPRPVLETTPLLGVTFLPLVAFTLVLPLVLPTVAVSPTERLLDDTLVLVATPVLEDAFPLGVTFFPLFAVALTDAEVPPAETLSLTSCPVLDVTPPLLTFLPLVEVSLALTLPLPTLTSSARAGAAKAPAARKAATRVEVPIVLMDMLCLLLV
jgi:hypothetical protein